MGSIILENVTKSFGEHHVIHGVNLNVGDGEFVVFVGPSGCGKSTLLRLIAGLEDISSGKISIDGEDVTDAPPSKRGLAMVFQSYALYPHMTVRDNIAFPLKMAKMDPAEIDKKVNEAARVLNLAQYLDRRPRQLSGGQRQRVAIARAIILHPSLILADEPTSALDVSVQAQILALLQITNRELGLACVFVSHNLGVIRVIADDVAVMQRGKIVEAGPVEQVFETPKEEYTRALIAAVPDPSRHRSTLRSPQPAAQE